jgi:FkbM family methyltransferase
MIDFDGWKLPDGESHLQEWMRLKNQRLHGRLTYQFGKYETALHFCQKRRLAVDVGAHVGLWSWVMSHDFENVAGFEPMSEHQACWHINMKDRVNAELFECALGAEKGTVSLKTNPTSSGDTYVVEGGDIEQSTLDSFNLDNVDFLKIDCEGYELNVLLGAHKTLLRCKPVVVVEQKGNMIEKYGQEKLGAVNHLVDLGAKVVSEISGDFILKWD